MCFKLSNKPRFWGQGSNKIFVLFELMLPTTKGEIWTYLLHKSHQQTYSFLCCQILRLLTQSSSSYMEIYIPHKLLLHLNRISLSSPFIRSYFCIIYYKQPSWCFITVRKKWRYSRAKNTNIMEKYFSVDGVQDIHGINS